MSRKPADNYKPVFSHGVYWHSGHELHLTVEDISGALPAPPNVYALRSTSQIVNFESILVAGRIVYLPTDADVTDKLTRLTDFFGNTTGWRLVNGADNSVETYDATGKFITLTDRNGLTRTLAYDASGRLATITDAYGHSLTLAYDAQNRVSTLIQPDAGIVTFAYDAANNISSITWPDAKTKTYLYENASFPNHLTGILDENSVRYVTYGYDSTGRASNESLAGGALATTLSFGTNSTTVTDALGTARTYNFQTILGVTKSTGANQPGGSGCGPAASGLTYDANGNVATRTDFNGTLTTYAYDLSRNLETQRVEASGTVSARTISTQWHATWRLPTKLSEPLKTTTWVYNGDSQGGSTVTCAPAGATVSVGTGTIPIGVLCRKIEQATLDANGSQGFAAASVGTPRTWSWTYDQYGQVLTSDGPRTDVSDVTTYSYYPVNDPDLGRRGNLMSVANALGHVTQITAYDANGRPLTIVDPNGLTTQLTYDPRGRITGRNVGGETTGYQYDGVGQLTRITLPDGAYLVYSYDAAHRLTGIADGLGNRIDYTLDLMGNRVKEDVKDPTSQLARTRSRAFDALNRLYQDIGASGQITTYGYDANGNLTGITDPLNRVTGNAYDALNRLIRITDPANGQTQMAYNGQDRLTQVTDPRSLQTNYTLDGLGNLSQQVSPDSGTTQSTHDAAGNVVSRTDAKGQVTVTQTDALNRPTLITYTDGRQERFTWDTGTNGIGRLNLIEELSSGLVTGSLQYGYDTQGRVTSETRSLGGVSATTGYQYANGRLTRITYPSGRQVDYTLDALGRIAQVTLTDQGVQKILASQVQYHPFGGIKSYVTGSGQTLTRSQDLDGRTNAYTLGTGLWQLGFDAASRITYQTDATNAANTASYGYDSLDRLTGSLLPNTSHGYGYDATGNRTSQTVGGTSYSYQVSPTSNRLQSINTVPPKSYAYDATGSVTGDGQNTFGYDARGRMVQAITAAGTTTYRIDALGQRVRKTNGTEDTIYHYDRAGHLISETDATGSAKREYFWLMDLPLAVMQ